DNGSLDVETTSLRETPNEFHHLLPLLPADVARARESAGPGGQVPELLAHLHGPGEYRGRSAAPSSGCRLRTAVAPPRRPAGGGPARAPRRTRGTMRTGRAAIVAAVTRSPARCRPSAS